MAMLCVMGFLTTEGGITDRFLRPAQLEDMIFVETPPGWLPRNEAEQVFRREWCADQGIPALACGPGPLARDDGGDRVAAPEFLPLQRRHWCRTVIDDADPEEDCTAMFAELDARYQKDWRRARDNAIDALPDRVLFGEDLRKADLRRARLEGADLRWALMEAADLTEAQMEGADLSRAWMKGADLSRARLEGADLRSAQMEGADLRAARMDADTLLTPATLQGAAVSKVNFKTVPIAASHLKATFGDASVVMPDGVPRPDHWPDWEMDWLLDQAIYRESLRWLFVLDGYIEWQKWQADPEGYVPPPAPAD